MGFSESSQDVCSEMAVSEAAVLEDRLSTKSEASISVEGRSIIMLTDGSSCDPEIPERSLKKHPSERVECSPRLRASPHLVFSLQGFRSSPKSFRCLFEDESLHSHPA